MCRNKNHELNLFPFLIGLITAIIFYSPYQLSAQQIKVGLLVNDKIEEIEELRAAENIMMKENPFLIEQISFNQIIEDAGLLNNYDLLWFHRPDTASFTTAELDKKVIKNLRDFVSGGGGLFLTLEAFKYINVLELETNIPETRSVESIDDGFGRKHGFHSLRSHPIFEGLNGGAYIFRPVEDMRVRQIGFFDNNVPNNGKVAAVDWAYIFLLEQNKMVLEYELGKGKILAVGGYTYFNKKNLNAKHLIMFAANSLKYLTGKMSEKDINYWNFQKQEVLPTSLTMPNITIKPSPNWKTNDSQMKIQSRIASDNFFDIAGRKILLMGKENGGLDEIWAHPFMPVRDYKVGIQFSYSDSVYWLNDQRPEIEISPESFTRLYKFKRAYLTEVLTADVNEAGGVFHYQYRGVYPAKLIVQYNSNFRIMWPYSEKALGSLFYSWNEAINAFVINDKSEDFSCFVGVNKTPFQTLIGQYKGFAKKDSLFEGISTDDLTTGALLQIKLEQNENIDVIFSASNQGINKTLETYKSIAENPQNVLTNASAYNNKILKNVLMINSPDENFNTGYKWAVIGTDKFFVNTPGLGESLMAGYATINRGWNGSQKVSGRPGYAWYFGRDAQWSGMAITDYGDFDKVKSIISFFQKYQDLNGKIFHELTTSGFAHYDAADATPLFIVLAGKYLRHSGDINFIKDSWNNIKRAIDFCFSTDTDKDHLIENTNEGHGWVEGGELFGAHTTLYLAGSWAAALKEASYMAAALDEDDLSEYYAEESELVKSIVQMDYWNEKNNFFNYGKLLDGSFNPERTLLPSVPLYFKQVSVDKAKKFLNTVASNNFTTNWGVRIVGEFSSMFQPTGYNYGSVWPLFTGWTALANYKYGKPIQGYTHILNNLNVYKNWSRGYVEEVLNGSEYIPTGVCNHQCWSETMVIQPAIEGMLGLEVSAIDKEIIIAPKLRPDWDNLSVNNIRIGEDLISFDYKRNNDFIQYNFALEGSGKVKLIFQPSLLPGTDIKKVLLNDEEYSFSLLEDGHTVSLLTAIDKMNPANIKIYFENGISVLPLEQIVKPTYKAEGLRIIDSGISGDDYIIKLESLTGKTDKIKVYSNMEIDGRITNANIISKNKNIYELEIKFEESGEKYSTETVRVKIK
ncbi:MAG: hypothetical protein CVV25_08590 [Ignavibacteriae bacterium HGW-Ignavibacteriae-4]|nr:MAG: hypothetical protein CVV25_08590 [Ignavibacteriae bacterium HGW-Ignavibacteriae-4]